jgi:histidinol-phosphate phosphatase family protein
MTEKKGIAVFLDRDGTVNVDYGFVCKPEDVKLLPGVVEAIRKLNKAGIPVFIISNQSGVGRGYYTVDDVKAVNEEIRRQLAEKGARVEDFYYCPHAPEEDCECRKPKIGLIQQAEEESDLDLKHIYTIGDKLSDVELAHNAGGTGTVVFSGQTKPEDIASWPFQPEFKAKNLIEDVEWILRDIKEKGG